MLIPDQPCQFHVGARSRRALLNALAEGRGDRAQGLLAVIAFGCETRQAVCEPGLGSLRERLNRPGQFEYCLGSLVIGETAKFPDTLGNHKLRGPPSASVRSRTRS